MAHFAELDENSVVVRVLVVHNDVTTIDGVEDEQRGIDFLAGMFPDSGTWVQTSYNGNFRTRYAGLGAVYDAGADLFSASQPYPSWTLDDEFVWQPPTPRPDDGNDYRWDEDSLAWVLAGE
jgi:hypothetical protein